MASFYSKPADYGTYTQPINLELVNFVMGARQEKYDYNLAKIESKIADQLGSLDLVRAQDKEYFLERAQQVLGSMGDMSKLDWSKNGVTRQVDAQINKVVDDKVLGDVLSTKNYRNFQRTIQAKDAEGKGKYDPKNVAYAMETQGVNAWLKGERDSLGSVQYQDYVDVGTELNEISENLHKFAKNIKTYTDPTGKRYYTTTEGKYLSAEEVKAIAKAQLSDKAKAQMRINGWAHYDGGVRSTEEIVTDFKGFSDGQLNNIDQKIASLEVKKELLGDKDPATASAIQRQIDATRNYRGDLEKSYNKWMSSGDKGNMTTTMESESVLNKFGQTFSIDDRITELIENPYTMAEYKEGLKRETERQKELTKARKEEKAAKAAFQLITPTLELTPVNRMAQLNKSIDEFDKGFKAAVLRGVNSLTPKMQEYVESAWEGSDKSIDKEAFIFNLLTSMSQEAGGSGAVPADMLANIDRTKRRRDRAIDMKNKSMEHAFDVLEEGGSRGNSLDNIVEEFADNKRITVLDENGNPTNAERLFSRYGIKTGEDLNNNPEVKKAVLKSYYADRIMYAKGSQGSTFLQALGAGMLASGTPGGSSVFTAAVGEFEDADLYMGRLTKLFGGDEGAAVNFIREAVAKGVGEKGAQFWDDSVAEDSSLKSWLSRESLEIEAARYLNDNQLTPTGKMVVVDNKSIPGGDLTNILNSQPALLGAAPGAKVKEEQSYTMEDLGNGMVRVFAQIESGTGNNKVIETRAVELPLENVPISIQSQIAFGDQAAIIDASNMEPVQAKTSFLSGNDPKAILAVQRLTGLDYGSASMYTNREDVQELLFDSYGSILGTTAQPTAAGKAIANMVNSDNIILGIEEVDKGIFMKTLSYIDPETQTPVKIFTDKRPLDPQEYEDQYFYTKYAPQIGVFELIKSSLDSTISRGGSPGILLNDIMKVYGG